MYKKILYPKTRRVSTKGNQIEITEKLDGSNLCIFRKGEDLIVAQRNNVFSWNSVKQSGTSGLYKGLYGWLNDNANELIENLHDGSGIAGEWLSMGKISYANSDIDGKYYIFAKARLEGETFEEYKLNNIIYSRDLIPYAFIERNIPDSIKLIPLIETIDFKPDKEYLDRLYCEYNYGLDRKCEGFIVNDNQSISKYVRYKDNKFTEHVDGND